jgi:hypothetical protein
VGVQHGDNQRTSQLQLTVPHQRDLWKYYVHDSNEVRLQAALPAEKPVPEGKILLAPFSVSTADCADLTDVVAEAFVANAYVWI